VQTCNSCKKEKQKGSLYTFHFGKIIYDYQIEKNSKKERHSKYDIFGTKTAWVCTSCVRSKKISSSLLFFGGGFFALFLFIALLLHYFDTGHFGTRITGVFIYDLLIQYVAIPIFAIVFPIIGISTLTDSKTGGEDKLIDIYRLEISKTYDFPIEFFNSGNYKIALAGNPISTEVRDIPEENPKTEPKIEQPKNTVVPAFNPIKKQEPQINGQLLGIIRGMRIGVTATYEILYVTSEEVVVSRTCEGFYHFGGKVLSESGTKKLETLSLEEILEENTNNYIIPNKDIASINLQKVLRAVYLTIKRNDKKTKWLSLGFLEMNREIEQNKFQLKFEEYVGFLKPIYGDKLE
jgi:hypothetical protein